MRPKKDIMTIGILLFASASFAGVVQDIYANTPEHFVHAECAEHAFYYKDTKKLFTRHYFSVKNTTGVFQNVTLTYKTCFWDGRCEQKVFTQRIDPWQLYVSKIEDTYYGFENRTPGTYNFTSFTTLNGYKGMSGYNTITTQKTCQVKILK